MTKFIFKILTIVCCLNMLTAQNVTRDESFRKRLGAENVKTLDFLVEDFENELKNKYPNLSLIESYTQYLQLISKDSNEIPQLSSLKARELFKASELRKELYMIPDSVWLEGDVIKKKILVWHNIETPYYVYDQTPLKNQILLNKDSIIDSMYESTIHPRLYGDFYEALRSISTDDEFVYGYYDGIEAAGHISPSVTANWMLKNNIDCSDYIYKRIVILEFAY